MAQTYTVELFHSAEPARVRYSCTCVADEPWLIDKVAGERLTIFGPLYSADRARAKTESGEIVWESPDSSEPPAA
jgi:hypothetical protein